MWETLLSNLPGMVYRCRNDPEWTMLFVSDGCRALTGYAPAELIENRRVSYAQLIVAADRAAVWEAVQAAVAKREAFELRYRIVTADGAEKWVWERGLGLFDAGGRLVDLEGFITDVTATVQAEAALRSSEEKFSKAFRASPDAISVSELATGRMIDVNEGFVRISGYTRDEIIGRTSAELGFWTAPETRAQIMTELAERGAVRELPVEARMRNGETRAFLLSAERVEIGGRPCLVIVSRDISEQKRAEQALRESEEKFSKAFRASPDAFSLSDFETTKFIAVNEGFVRIFGYSREEVIGRSARELGLWLELRDRERMLAEVEATGSVRNLQTCFRTRRNGDRQFLLSAERVEISGRPCLVVVSHDITEQKRAEQALRESEEKFARAFRASPTALTITELPSGRYVDVNAGFERTMGHTREEVVGRTAIEIGIWADLQDRAVFIRRMLQNRIVRDLECTFVTRAGQPVITLVSADMIEIGGKTCALSVIHDITEQRRAEQARSALETQLRQTQKLEALGQLAGGIAHDFNNILTGILAYAELIQLDAERPAEVRKHVAAVKAASRRASDLVRQILTFSRRQAPERKPVKLSAVVREALKLLRSTLPRTIEIVEQIDDLAPVVLADATQIHQVLMNLCTNAAHAMQDRPGRLAVTLATCEVRAGERAAPASVAPGRHARLTVADTGRGMDAATLSRIFEPFFTTKEPGHGTGLGLAVVHGIVEEHDGVITVRSAPGAGTTFDIYFPEFCALDLDAAPAETPLPRGTGQRVLFVDDEEAIARAVVDLLGRLGYRVTMHTDPRAAWSAFDRAPTEFDLVVTDLTMPHWTGLELARRLLARRPDVPIVLSTGHGGAWTPESVRMLGLRSMIGKPLTVTSLAREIHAILGDAAL